MPTTIERNVIFWHRYPELLVGDLTPDQLRWQPEHHDTSILFALWHAYRAGDDLIHAMVAGRPSVFVSQGWADRLPVAQTGATPFGNGLTREQIAAIDIGIEHVVAYARAVGESVAAYTAALSAEEAAEEVRFPFFAAAYPGYDVMSRLDAIAFFAIGHTSEHLGEVQMLRGLMGLRGAPL